MFAAPAIAVAIHSGYVLHSGYRLYNAEGGGAYFHGSERLRAWAQVMDRWGLADLTFLGGFGFQRPCSFSPFRKRALYHCSSGRLHYFMDMVTISDEIAIHYVA